MIARENLFWILAYATEELSPVKRGLVTSDDTDAPLDALATTFVATVERVVKRGIARGYARQASELGHVRGKIDVLRTFRRDSLSRGRVCCRFDELTSDVNTNRVLRTALRLVQASNIPRDTRKRAQSLERWFLGVGLLRRHQRFASVSSTTNSRWHYDVSLALAGYIIAGTVPAGAGRHARFIEAELTSPDSRLFERFVRNFFRRHLTGCIVTRHRRPWSSVHPCTADAKRLLPEIETDVVLEYVGRKVVIETKYYRETLRQHRGSRRVREAHLYQLMAYLHNQRLRSPQDDRIEGVLLYPEMEAPVDAAWVIHGFPVRVRTLDLSSPWRGLRQELLDIGGQGGLYPSATGETTSPSP